MKKILIFFIINLTFSITSWSQLPKDVNTGKITYTEVVNTDNSSTKQELYSKAKLWMVTNFVSGSNPLNYYDENAGIIIANGSFDADYLLKGGLQADKFTCNVRYTIKISVKDKKYKYEITNFTWQIKSWTLTDEEGNIRPIGYTSRNSLDESVPTIKGGLIFAYSRQTKNNALRIFYAQIDNEIKNKIASLAKAMNENFFQDDDDW